MESIEMDLPRKQTVDILVEGKRKRLRGVTKYTTCDDVIRMVIQKTSQRPEDARALAVFECFSGSERVLSKKDRILKVMRSSGSDCSTIGFSVRCVDDVRKKMTSVKDKNKRLKRLRTRAFDAVSFRKESFLSDTKTNISSLDFTNSVEHSKQRLETLKETNHSGYYKKRFSGLRRKNETETKQSVFRKLFTNVFKRKTTSKINAKRNCKLNEYNINEHNNVHINKSKEFTYTDLQRSFKAQLDRVGERRLDSWNKGSQLDMAFIDENDHLDDNEADVSVLNQCIVEDVMDNSESFKNIETVENHSFCEKNSLVADQTYVKLDKIKQMFEINTTQCRSEDDFMDSFMRTKLYESESDGDSL